MTWRQMILAYCSQLREQAAGRASGDLVLASERAALARAQRERIEMQNAVTRGELAPVVAIEQVLAQAGSKVAAVLDTIPGMIRRRVPGLSAADIELVASEVAKARNIAAAIRMADLDDEPEEAEALAADAAQAEVDA
jgi:phage terminase Nu1 subunit (DNA packaging protein)